MPVGSYAPFWLWQEDHLDYLAEVDLENPISHWRVNETSGTVAVDRKGVSNGTYQNSPSLNASGLLRVSGDRAVRFSPTNSRISWPSTPAALKILKGSLEMWVSPRQSVAAARRIFGSDANFSLDANGAVSWTVRDANSVDTTIKSSNNVIATNGVYHLVGVYDGLAGVIAFYVNGVAVTNPPNRTPNAVMRTVAPYSANLDQTDIVVDELAVYGNVLTADQVWRHYATGFAESLPPTATTDPASSIAIRSARLNGTITRPTERAVSYWFEYGPTAALGMSTATTTLGSALGTTTVQADISALDVKKMYHFRLAVDTGSSIVYGSTLTFTTLTEPITALVTKFDGGSFPAEFTTTTGVDLDNDFDAAVFDNAADVLSTDYVWDIREQSFTIAVARGSGWIMSLYFDEANPTRRVRLRGSGNQLYIEEVSGSSFLAQDSFSDSIQTWPWHYLRFTHAAGTGWSVARSDDRVTWGNSRTIAITNAPTNASKLEFVADPFAGESMALLAINDVGPAPGITVDEPFDALRTWVLPYVQRWEVVAGSLRPTLAASDGEVRSLGIDARGSDILVDLALTSGSFHLALRSSTKSQVAALYADSPGNLRYAEPGAFTTTIIAPYSAVTHRWIGFRFNYDGTMSFLTSADGVSKTAHGSFAYDDATFAAAHMQMTFGSSAAVSVSQIVGVQVPLPLPEPSIGTPTRTRISSVSGFDETLITWSSNTPFTAYQWRVVSSASDPVTSGVQVEMNQNPTSGGAANTQYTSVITDDEILAVSPSEGAKILKLFLQNANGWSS